MTRKCIMRMLKDIDPQSSSMRKQHRLKRRQYICKVDKFSAV